MSVSLMAAGAWKVVKTCAAVQPGELVLILTDAGVPPQVGEALVFATTAAGATAITLTMPRLRQPGAEPPRRDGAFTGARTGTGPGSASPR